jgi:hypothetical protein
MDPSGHVYYHYSFLNLQAVVLVPLTGSCQPRHLLAANHLLLHHWVAELCPVKMSQHAEGGAL